MSEKRALRLARSDAIEIIEQVRKRPCIWDRSSVAYRNRSEKDRAWRDVCRALDPAYDHKSPADRYELVVAMIQKWNNLRDSYRKCCKSSVSGSPGHLSRYVWADRLSFLDSVLKFPDGPAKRPKIEVEDSSEDCSEAPNNVEWLRTDYEDESENISKLPEPTGGERMFGDESITSILVGLLEKEEDEDRAFFKSIMPTVKALPHDAKFEFRIQVMKALNALRKKPGDDSNTKRTDKYFASDTE